MEKVKAVPQRAGKFSKAAGQEGLGLVCDGGGSEEDRGVCTET